MSKCANCGEDNPARARFCLACGTPLAGALQEREVRKTVTVVFTDTSGFTNLGERMDPESLRNVMSRYFDEMSSVLERYGGTVEKFIGDAVMAVFGIPVVHEDDPLRAVTATLEMAEALGVLNEELQTNWGVSLQIRTGVETGPVVAGAGQALVTGDAVNVAARLEQAAAPGEILIGARTLRLVRDFVEVDPVEPFSLKGKEDVVSAYRLLGLRSHQADNAAPHDSPMIGRERELSALMDAFEAAVAERRCHLSMLVGGAGVGKSRLAGEFLHAVGDRARVLGGRCLPYGEGNTFWPLKEVIREAAGLTPSDTADEARSKVLGLLNEEETPSLIADRLYQVLDLAPASATPDEVSWGVRKLFESLAQELPLVIVFEDLHWAEPTFLDLVEHVTQWSHSSPLLLLCSARADLLEDRPGWGAGSNSQQIYLEPLGADLCGRLIDNLLGETTLLAELKERIARVAAGNPFFVEEMIAMLIEDGLLTSKGGVWSPSSDASSVPIPPSIQLLLAARLDRLQDEERQVIEGASVVGEEFSGEAAAALAPKDVRERVPGHLKNLVRKEMVQPNPDSLLGGSSFHFRHILIRDAAYDSLPKKLRADLHEHFAYWMEEVAGERVSEYEEITGYHLEQAYRYRAELGRLGQEGSDLAGPAAERLGSAGRRAVARSDAPAAVNLLNRAISLLPTTDKRRLELLPHLARALYGKGDLRAATTLMDETVEGARSLGDERLASSARILQLELQFMLDPEGRSEEALREAESLLPMFEETGDDAILAQIHWLFAQVNSMHTQWKAAEEPLEKAIFHARRAGDVREEHEDLRWLAITIRVGPRPAAEALARCEVIAEELRDNPAAEASVFPQLACLHAMNGDFERAREFLQRARSTYDEFGMAFTLAAMGSWEGTVEMLAGNYEEAVAAFRQSVDLHEQMGERTFGSTMAALLADALLALGRIEEAEHYARVSERDAASDDLASQMMFRSVLARAFAERGEAKAARSMAVSAVAVASTTDNHDAHGNVLMNLASTYRALGDGEQATRLMEQALQLFEAKGNKPSAERARRALEAVTT